MSTTAFCYEEQKGDVIAVFAIASFLAGTRNLMLWVVGLFLYVSLLCEDIYRFLLFPNNSE